MRRLFGPPSRGPGLSVACLAPMVDLLTILLVVLLRTWSSDPPLEIQEEGFALPISREEAAPGEGVTIDIGTEGMYVNGWRAGSSNFWSDSDEILVKEVYEELQGAGGAQAVVRAHKDAPWALVGKVMFTVQQAGYERIELIALSRASL